MPSKVLPFYHMYSSKVLKHFTGNGWFSLQHIILLTRLGVSPKSGILVVWHFMMDMAQCNTSIWSGRCLKNIIPSWIYPKYGFKALQKQYMALLATYHPSFQAESGPKISRFSGFLTKSLMVIAQLEHKRQVDAFKSIVLLSYVFKQGFETLQ